jgi:hypothetical protein
MKNIYFAAFMVMAPFAAVAETFATGDQIIAAIAGNTVQGGMVETGAYTEFYQADGSIKGADYTGKWSIKDNQMCFDYGDGVECLSVRIEGDAVTWISDGADDGTGTIVPGNPNNY